MPRLRSAVFVLALGSSCGGGDVGPPAVATPPSPTAPTPPEVAPPPPTGATLRFLSLAIRDAPPTLDETRAFLDGEKDLEAFTEEWLRSPAHLARMERFFDDFFGIYVGFTPLDSFQLLQNADGVYRMAGADYLGVPPAEDCTLAEALERPAWWLEEGETLLICPSSESDAFLYESSDPVLYGPMLCDSGYARVLDPRCGCGPYQLLCIPCAATGRPGTECVPGAGRNRELEADFNREPVARGLHVYEEGLSWFDWFGGDFFYGDRDLYLYYLQGQGGLMTGEVTAEEAIDQLWAIPMDHDVEAPWPWGAERAGVVTSTGFLNTYNTFRSRARVLSLKLLCHDVDASLNPDGYAQFLNPNFTESDIAHGERPECSYCHYGMDNQASMLFGYDFSGWSEYYTGAMPSQLGHVFGEDAEGPSALVSGYIDRGPGFDACMASTTFGSLTGLSFESDLTEVERADLTERSAAGPRALVEAILTSPTLRAATPE